MYEFITWLPPRRREGGGREDERMNRNRTKQRGSDLYAADAGEELSPLKEYIASRLREGVDPEQVRYAALSLHTHHARAACTCPHRGRSGVVSGGAGC